MKLLKLVLSLVLVSLVSTTAINAQRTERKARKQVSTEERAQKQTDRLAKKLKLDATQSKALLAINLKYAKQAKELAKEKNRSAQKAKYKAQRENQNKEIEALLTEAQLAVYTETTVKRKAKKAQKVEKKKEQKEMKKAKKRANTVEAKAERRTEFLTSKLGLSEEQVTKTQAINLDYFTSVAKMKVDLKAKKIEKMDKKSLKDKRRMAMKNILTDEQFQLMTKKKEKK